MMGVIGNLRCYGGVDVIGNLRCYGDMGGIGGIRCLRIISIKFWNN